MPNLPSKEHRTLPCLQHPVGKENSAALGRSPGPWHTKGSNSLSSWKTSFSICSWASAPASAVQDLNSKCIQPQLCPVEGGCFFGSVTIALNSIRQTSLQLQASRWKAFLCSPRLSRVVLPFIDSKAAISLFRPAKDLQVSKTPYLPSQNLHRSSQKRFFTSLAHNASQVALHSWQKVQWLGPPWHLYLKTPPCLRQGIPPPSESFSSAMAAYLAASHYAILKEAETKSVAQKLWVEATLRTKDRQKRKNLLIHCAESNHKDHPRQVQSRGARSLRPKMHKEPQSPKKSAKLRCHWASPNISKGSAAIFHPKQKAVDTWLRNIKDPKGNRHSQGKNAPVNHSWKVTLRAVSLLQI